MGIIIVLCGIGFIVLGLKGFTESGIPWSSTKNITGPQARAVGWACIGLGTAILLFCAWFIFVASTR